MSLLQAPVTPDSRRELEDCVGVLYSSPLKALNNDIHKNLVEPLRGIKEYARKAGFDVPDVRSDVRTGDTPPQRRTEMARRPPHILITTPESLFIILATEKFREAFRKVKYVIVDEIHAVLFLVPDTFKVCKCCGIKRSGWAARIQGQEMTRGWGVVSLSC